MCLSLDTPLTPVNSWHPFLCCDGGLVPWSHWVQIFLENAWLQWQGTKLYILHINLWGLFSVPCCISHKQWTSLNRQQLINPTLLKFTWCCSWWVLHWPFSVAQPLTVVQPGFWWQSVGRTGKFHRCQHPGRVLAWHLLLEKYWCEYAVNLML